MITPVCQTLDVFQSFHATRHTLVNRRIPSLFNSFSILDRISSSPATFPDFNPCIAAATSVNAKTSFFRKSIASQVSVGVAHTGFNNLQSILSNVKGFPFISEDIPS